MAAPFGVKTCTTMSELRGVYERGGGRNFEKSIQDAGATLAKRTVQITKKTIVTRVDGSVIATQRYVIERRAGPLVTLAVVGQTPPSRVKVRIIDAKRIALALPNLPRAQEAILTRDDAR